MTRLASAFAKDRPALVCVIVAGEQLDTNRIFDRVASNECL